MKTSFTRYKLKIAAIFCFSLASICALAHEFWLDPISFRVKEVWVRFKVGEHFLGDNWKGNAEKVQLLALIYLNQHIKIAPSSLKSQGDSIKIKLPFEGTHTLIFNSTNSFIELLSTKFNEYLKEDGLDNIALWRHQHGQDSTAGREYYQRSVKTLLQNGGKTTNVSQKTNLPLDIVPLINPYDFKKQQRINFMVYFKQQLLQEGLIRVWHKNKEGQVTESAINMKNGTFSIDATPQGQWMVSMVHMTPNNADQQADWQSFWGSVSWGYF